MKAIDTNILIRFLTGEDHPQTRIARDLVAAGDLFVSSTVLLESAWVLRSSYGFDRLEVIKSLRVFLGLPGINCEAPEMIARALDHAANSMDIADALHLGTAAHCDGMLSFDRKFVAVSAKAATSPKVQEPTSPDET